jgi:hypothetical protein
VCVLIEHQSAADPVMPFRLLHYAVYYWEREHRRWQEGHPRGDPLRLTPVFPVVLHTGTESWSTSRTLADLMAVPEPLRAIQPRWEPVFFDLAAFEAAQLLALPGDWLPTLALVRTEKAEKEEFWSVFKQVLHKLEPLSEQEKTRWEELLYFVLSWSVRRRPKPEREVYRKSVQESEQKAQLKEEIEKMSKIVEKSWEEEVLEQGLKLGEERGIKKGEERGIIMGEERGELRGCRKSLRRILEARFGPLPEEWVKRIEAVNDLPQLEAATDRALKIPNLDALQL